MIRLKEFSTQAVLLARMVTGVLPQVEKELDRWRQQLCACGDGGLGSQAAASIRLKRFHTQGGSVYAVGAKSVRRDLVILIVALQTISDYLDNLCNRAGVEDERAFRQLHAAMTHAVDPVPDPRAYYRFYPYGNDGGYLEALVAECNRIIGGAVIVRGRT